MLQEPISACHKSSNKLSFAVRAVPAGADVARCFKNASGKKAPHMQASLSGIQVSVFMTFSAVGFAGDSLFDWV
jgi:hypothetical protein